MNENILHPITDVQELGFHLCLLLFLLILSQVKHVGLFHVLMNPEKGIVNISTRELWITFILSDGFKARTSVCTRPNTVFSLNSEASRFCMLTSFPLSLALQPSLGLGLLHKIRLNFLEASEQFSFYRVG
jgi:hypothetical protein